VVADAIVLKRASSASIGSDVPSGQESHPTMRLWSNPEAHFLRFALPIWWGLLG
jgi:hypothetical protein